jgi:hypothetical protein
VARSPQSCPCSDIRWIHRRRVHRPGHADRAHRLHDPEAAYDLRKLRGKQLVTKPGRSRRYHLDPRTAGTIAALLTLREQVIAPILAGVRSPRMGRKPATWTNVDRDYEKIRIDMQTLFQDLGTRAAG